MFTKVWILPATAILSLLLAYPCVADVAASGYDRMDGDYIRANRRPTPKRNFNSTLPDEERLNVYSVKRQPTTRAGRNTSTGARQKTVLMSEEEQIVEQQNEPYAADLHRIDPESVSSGQSALATDGTAGEVGSGESSANPATSGGAVETTEAGGAPSGSAGETRYLTDAEAANHMVFCSKKLLEYHWDRNCPLLKGVKPTPLTLISAKNSFYIECTGCRESRPRR